MEVSELVLWMDKAIDVREKSYVPKEGGIGSYKINNLEALDQTKPPNTKQFERDIAGALIGWGNDITDWKTEIEKSTSKLGNLVDRSGEWDKKFN